MTIGLHPASGSTPAGGVGRGLVFSRTPAAARRSNSAPFSGSSRNVRTDLATTGPTSGTAGELLDVACAQCRDRPECPGQRARAALADVPDADPVQLTPQLGLLALVDFGDEVRGRLLAHPIESGELVGASARTDRRSRGPVPA